MLEDTAFPLSDATGAAYDRLVQGTGGIKPDIQVIQPEEFTDQDWSNENKRHDLQLRKAIEPFACKRF